MSRERMSAKPVRSAKHSDSSQITKTTGTGKTAVVTVIEQFMTVVKDSLAHGVDYDYHINTGELPELFDESSVDDFIADLNDWD